ncbi:uncharacterized protein LOC118178020 [Oxyura jamaicensis]|uniref:uncharacterized protein LOC118178020 n=1 Tax=Oxyura jamaicensis TaxID=8884 RepID=UPI0015A60F28|nr:uncharacterized protein LOC118178020 [Oxyura jamaicensis]
MSRKSLVSHLLHTLCIEVPVCEARTSKWMMAALLFLLQFLFFGTLIVPAYLQMQECNPMQSAIAGNFSVTVIPQDYRPNTTYEVTIVDSNNTTSNVTNYLLQAISPQNASVGEWNVTNKQNCSAHLTAVLPKTQKTANWTSPTSNFSSVDIRAYIVFENSSTVFKTVTLNQEAKPTGSTNSVSAVQSSSFFVAAIQLLMLLATSKLLS